MEAGHLEQSKLSVDKYMLKFNEKKDCFTFTK